MTDYAAQLLNELMGRNRDLLPDQQAQKLTYDSPEVSWSVERLGLADNNIGR